MDHQEKLVLNTFTSSSRHAEAIKDEAAAVLAPMGLELSSHKTRISHLDEGFDFLRFRIRRHRKRGTNTKHVYTYPTKAALAAVKANVRTLTSRATTSKTLASHTPSLEVHPSGMEQLLPPRRLGAVLRLPKFIYLAASGPMAEEEAPQG